MQVGGVLTLLAGVFILMGIITAETQYPSHLHYSTRTNEISDLGATVPPHSIITEPSAHIFDTVMIVTGLMLIAGAIFSYSAHRRKVFAALALLLGIGVLGVGIFPGNHHDIHRIFSMIAFLFGGLAAVMSYRAVKGPFRFIVLLLGSTTLLTLFVGTAVLTNTLGAGGIERWIAYPVVLWMVCYGGYVLGDKRSIA
jgi:hypothetical membrane protein